MPAPLPPMLHCSDNGEGQGLDAEALISSSRTSSYDAAREWNSRCRFLGAATLSSFVATALFALLGRARLLGSGHAALRTAGLESDLQSKVAATPEDPMWGCGLVGSIPGILANGQATHETQRLIDGLKSSSSFKKATFWNWNLAPEATEHLTSDFMFMPEMWGAGVVDAQHVRPAGVAGFLDSAGKASAAEMSTLFLGMNEPDIRGSCLGSTFGKCLEPGQCGCAIATGVGFWPLAGCSGQQPLVKLWQDPACSNVVVDNWKKTAAIAFSKGYKFLSTPLVAVDVGYAQKFLEKACGCTAPGRCTCTDASCGCPVYIGFHFYAYDCRPEVAGYRGFLDKLGSVTRIMELYPFVKGAIINEVGMLNCAPSFENPICVPNSGRNPALQVPDHGCPNNTLSTFMDKIFDYVIAQKTADGRRVVKAFSWFNEDMVGGTYNLRLFNKAGSLNAVGESYIRNCARWGNSWRAR